MHLRQRIWNRLDFGYACHLFCSLLKNSDLSRLKQIHALLLRTNFAQEDTIFALLLEKIQHLKQFKYARMLFYSFHRPFSEDLLHYCLASYSKLTQLKQIHAVLLTTGLTVNAGYFTLLLEKLLQIEEFDYVLQLVRTMHKPRVYAWNALIINYVSKKRYVDALSLYTHMRCFRISPNEFTFPSFLTACAKLKDVRLGKAIHGLIVKFDTRIDAYVLTELMVMYAKLGNVRSVNYLFESRSDVVIKDRVFWNALISAFMQSGNENKSLDFFIRMSEIGMKPNAITLVSAISSCAHLGSLEFGRKLHSYAIELNMKNVYVENALLDMYSKCGNMGEASKVFYGMNTRRNVVSWSTMINGFALNGEGDKALLLYSQMQGEGVQPNHVTMLAVLTACNHAGLVNKGKEYFSSITNPTLEHYTAMADLLGRSGQLDEAYSFIKAMPIEPDAAIWWSLVKSCKLHGNTTIGRIASDELYKLQSYQILLSNMFVVSGRVNDAKDIGKKMKWEGMKKVSGNNLVELNDELYGSGSCILQTAKDHTMHVNKYTKSVFEDFG